MAYIPDPRTVVKKTERLWSEIVAIADAQDPVIRPYDPAYRFTNGKEFVEKEHYRPLNDAPADNPPDA